MNRIEVRCLQDSVSITQRLSYLYTHTHEKDCIAVVNPVEKTWFTVHSGWLKNCWGIQDEELRACEKAYTDEFHELRCNQVPFDYLDEGLLSQDGNVIQENGVTKLQIGALSYATVYYGGVKLITNDGEKYLCYAPYTAAIVRKTPVALSVVLGAQDLFYNK